VKSYKKGLAPPAIVEKGMKKIQKNCRKGRKKILSGVQ